MDEENGKEVTLMEQVSVWYVVKSILLFFIIIIYMEGKIAKSQ